MKDHDVMVKYSTQFTSKELEPNSTQSFEVLSQNNTKKKNTNIEILIKVDNLLNAKDFQSVTNLLREEFPDVIIMFT
jgi:hypothetical protein